MKSLKIIFLLLFLAGAPVFAQNPTLVYPTNGLTNTPANVHSGKVTIGLNSVGQADGKFFGQSAGVVGWFTPSGSGGGDVFLNSNNVFTANNTFPSINSKTNLASTTYYTGTNIWIDASPMADKGYWQMGRFAIQQQGDYIFLGDTNYVINAGFPSIKLPRKFDDEIEIVAHPLGKIRFCFGNNCDALQVTTNHWAIGFTNNWISLDRPNVMSFAGDADKAANTLIITNYGSLINMSNLTVNGNFTLPVTQGSVLFGGSGGTIAQDNSNFFWDLTNHRLGIGTTTPASRLQIINTNGLMNFIMQDSYSSAAPTDGPDVIMRRARGTLATPTAVISNDLLGVLSARGYGSTTFSTGGRGRIQIRALETWTDTQQGAEVAIQATPIGTNLVQDILRIGTSEVLVSNNIRTVLTSTASNFASTAGPSVWTTGTNTTFLLNVNSGNGIATMQASNTFFTGLINAPSNSAAFIKNNTLVTLNSLNTNNTGARQFVNASVTLTPAVSDKAEARLFVFSPGTTNLSCIASAPATTIGAFIYPMTAMVSPGDIFVISNFSTGSGTAFVTNSTRSAF